MNTKPEFKLELVDEDDPSLKYSLKISTSSNSLDCKVLTKGKFPNDAYNEAFSLDQLVQISKWFSLNETVDDVLVEILNISAEKPMTIRKVIEEEKEKVELTLHPNSGKYKNISMKVSKATLSQDIINTELLKIINQMNERLAKTYERLDTINERINNMNISVNEINEKQIQIEEKFQNKDEQLNAIKNWIKQDLDDHNDNIEFTLLYSASRDGDSEGRFHEKCDNKGPTLSVVLTTGGYKFGGFTYQSWDQSDCYKTDTKAFLFSMNKMEMYKVTHPGNAIYCYSKTYMSKFGNGDIIINDKCLSSTSSFVNGPSAYLTPPNFALNGGTKYFQVKEYEVYSIVIN